MIAFFFNKVPQGRVFTTETPPFGQAPSGRQIHPFDIEMVLLVSDVPLILRLADALHKAPLLDRMLVKHVEVSRKQSEGLCTP